MSVINTNVKSLIAQNAMTSNGRVMSKVMEQLSTGKRINGAADDSAGLAISERMTAQIRGLNQAVRNANDGISLIQTAEGAMVEVTNMMQRMRELAVQSSSDTNSTDDRANMDLEFQALATEITRVRDTTQFNGIDLLNGASAFTFQIGTDATETVALTIADIAGSASTNGTSITVATTAATTSAGQISILDLGLIEGNLVLDTAVEFSLGGKTFNFTVTAADVADYSGSNATDGVGDLLVTRIAAAINADSDFQGVINAIVTTDGTNKLTLKGADYNTSFSLSATRGGTDATTVSGDVLTQSAASTAITTLDSTIDAISLARGNLGASMNRLNYAADNLTNISTNTSASRSRILDTDYAQASTELARTQIIQQAATAMLAQANQQSQTVLSLLQ